MKKKFLFPFLIMFVNISAQVGVNTTNPMGSFHVDGNKDNGTSTTLTASQQANDFIVASATGNVGIGTTSPTTKLHINSATSPAIKIVDGSQAAGNVLMSDANGAGSWVTLTKAVVGTFGSGYSGAVSNKDVYTGVSITLPPGKWMVLTNIVLKAATAPSASSNQGAWVRLGWSNTQNTSDTTTTQITANLSSGAYVSPYAFASGTTIINNTSGATKTYYLNVFGVNIYGGYSSTWSAIGAASYPENSVIAYPAL